MINEVKLANGGAVNVRDLKCASVRAAATAWLAAADVDDLHDLTGWARHQRDFWWDCDHPAGRRSVRGVVMLYLAAHALDYDTLQDIEDSRDFNVLLRIAASKAAR